MRVRRHVCSASGAVGLKALRRSDKWVSRMDALGRGGILGLVDAVAGHRQRDTASARSTAVALALELVTGQTAVHDALALAAVVSGHHELHRRTAWRPWAPERPSSSRPWAWAAARARAQRRAWAGGAAAAAARGRAELAAAGMSTQTRDAGMSTAAPRSWDTPTAGQAWAYRRRSSAATVVVGCSSASSSWRTGSTSRRTSAARRRPIDPSRSDGGAGVAASERARAPPIARGGRGVRRSRGRAGEQDTIRRGARWPARVVRRVGRPARRPDPPSRASGLMTGWRLEPKAAWAAAGPARGQARPARAIAQQTRSG